MNGLLCLFFLSIILVSAQLGIRDLCGQKKDKVCILVENCKEAVDLIKQREHDKIVVCGWQGKTQIVCCDPPESSKNPTASNESKAEEECKKLSPGEIDLEPFITNGQNATLGTYPHMAALGYQSDNVSVPYDFRCAGTLINENYVLTAAHCFSDRMGFPVIVRLGKVDLFGNEDKTEAQDISVKEEDVIAYPDYNYFTRQNDLALIRLSTPAKFTKYVLPACLYTEKDIPLALHISGWGLTKAGGTLSRFLQHAPVKHIDLDRCNDVLPKSHKAVIETQLCALGDEENITSDTCQGDSGGPIQTENRKGYGSLYTVVGVTSYGATCGSKVPGIYTRVSSYLDWIESTAWPN